MADSEDVQPLVCDNGTGMVKVSALFFFPIRSLRSSVQCFVEDICDLLSEDVVCDLCLGWICW